MIDIKEIFAGNIKKIRRKKGLTQEKLAEKAGMSLQYLALLELARKFPSGEMLERLATALEIETYELLAVASSANNELELLRNDIICEVKTLNESLAKNITDEVINAIKQTLSDECKK
ncbi:MAG: helix-turn-helix transcriptional regulator [Treponema sp.]|jgi:transcriptional regulator with XRE-family HTH domain|nr:helix-turn-helix transcriptional regulator [Treponema sp.]